MAHKPAADPLALLRYEHRALENLFGQFVLRKDQRSAQRVCAALRSHLTLEEGFYREAETLPDIHGKVEASLEECGSIRDLMRTVGALEEGEALHDQMLALQRSVDSHVREEERAIFPAVVKGLSRQRLQDLNTGLRTTKDKIIKDSEGDRD